MSPTTHAARTLRILCLTLFCLFGVRVGQAADKPDLVVASAKDHVWFIAEDSSVPVSWRLMHHSSGMDGPHARVARTFKNRPMALAAMGDQVLVLMSPRVGGGVGSDLLGLRVVRNPAMGSYYDLPVDGWRVLASLPPDARFGGLELDANGHPVGLLLPDRRVSKGVVRDGADQRDPPAPARLLEQRNFEWFPIELPKDLLTAEVQRLVPSPAGVRASILAPDESGGARLHRRLEESWSVWDMGVPNSDLVSVIPFQERLAIVTQENEGPLSVRIERGDTLLPVAQMPVPSGEWGFASIGDAILLIEIGDKAVIRVRTIDPLSGSVSEPVEWIRPPLDVSDWLHLPIIGMIVVTALLVIVLFRPSEMPDMPLRAGVRPLPLPRRLLALFIDFIPGLVIVLLAFDLDLSRISTIPLWSSELAFAVPGLVLVGVTLLHETVSELIWRKTIGKKLVGGVVLTSSGGVPAPSTILLRAVFKGVVFYAPILAIFVLFSPALQGVPETVSRTVVADARPKENSPEAE